jgi:hypothetical protein
VLAVEEALALLGSKHCGDTATCDAVKEHARGERAVVLEHVRKQEWNLPADMAGFIQIAPSLHPDERDRLWKMEKILSITVYGTVGPNQMPARTAFAVAAAIAEKTKGYVFDQLNGRIESANDFLYRCITTPLGQPSFKKTLLDFQYVPRGDGTVRLLTTGMKRLGGPDIEVAEVSVNVAERMVDIMAAVADQIVQGADESPVTITLADMERVRGARYPTDVPPQVPVEIDLVHVKPQQGDGNVFMRIQPPHGTSADDYREIAEQFFGEIEADAPSDEEIEAIKKRAQDTLGTALEKSKSAIVFLQIPMRMDAGVEWGWIKLLSHDDKTVTGTLAEDAIHILTAKKGDRLTRPKDEVIDWRVQNPDGTIEQPPRGEP